ncbi:MAG: hypothetical protein JWQ24_2111 [Tardiphaga sp.]|nr:hypothetical protein [Tardiphaga sp.]
MTSVGRPLQQVRTPGDRFRHSARLLPLHVVVGILKATSVKILAMRDGADDEPSRIEHPEALVVAFLDRPRRGEFAQIVQHRRTVGPLMTFPEA